MAEVDKIQVACPNCGKAFRVQAIALGRQARCTQCEKIFVLAAPAPGERSMSQGPPPYAPTGTMGVQASAQVAPRPIPVAPYAPQSPYTAPPPPPYAYGQPRPAAVPPPPLAGALPPAHFVPAAEAPVAKVEEKKAVPTPAATRAVAGSGVCPVCRVAPAAGEAVIVCPTCHTAHHPDCWEYNEGCGKYGCETAPETRKLQDTEIPSSYWGQSEKDCPVCRQKIQAAAVRCRFCGATFASQRPQEFGEFAAQKTAEANLPKLRQMSIWLLVFCLLPCTSTIAGIVGIIWFFKNRQGIKKLPAQQAALSKIAIGVSGLQTAIVLVIAIVYGLAS